MLLSFISYWSKAELNALVAALLYLALLLLHCQDFISVRQHVLLTLLHAVLIMLLLCIFRSFPHCAGICGAFLAWNISNASCQSSWKRYHIYLFRQSLEKIKLLQCERSVGFKVHCIWKWNWLLPMNSGLQLLRTLYNKYVGTYYAFGMLSSLLNYSLKHILIKYWHFGILLDNCIQWHWSQLTDVKEGIQSTLEGGNSATTFCSALLHSPYLSQSAMRNQ